MDFRIKPAISFKNFRNGGGRSINHFSFSKSSSTGRSENLLFPMKGVFLVLLLGSGPGLYAQRRSEVWAKLGVTKNVSEKISIGIDLQHRRQEGWGERTQSPFQYPMLNSVRLMMYFNSGKNWTLTISPFAFFENTILSFSDSLVRHNHEMRMTAGAIKKYSIGRITNTNRFLYELSTIQYERSISVRRNRYRVQTGLTYMVKKMNSDQSLHLDLSNELLVKTAGGKTAFDQNRLYSGLKWKWKQYDTYLGYQYTYQKELQNYMSKNQILLGFQLSL